jgi:RNAse (barnase) inhibitor barstar
MKSSIFALFMSFNGFYSLKIVKMLDRIWIVMGMQLSFSLKLCWKANGEKRKVASKFFEAFIGVQQKFHTKMFCGMAFLSFAHKSRA